MKRSPILLALTLWLMETNALLNASERVGEKVGELPGSAELASWLTSADQAERGLSEGAPSFTLQMKKAHVYARVLDHEAVVGRFRPETATTSVRAEITTYHIGRALGCGELFQPATEMELTGKGLATFRQLLQAAAFRDIKDEERQDLLLSMENEPNILRGAYKPMTPDEAVKYRGAERPEEAPNGGLETGDVIARYLQHTSPQPGHESVSLPHTGGLRGSTRKLARQLSNILLVDALAGQWDRFSGNNLHVLPTADGVQFLAIDNGGADPQNDQGYLEKFTQWVTRFDPEVVHHLTNLDAFLQGRGTFRGFADESDLATALHFENPQEWSAFKDRVHRVAAHVHTAREGAYFEP